MKRILIIASITFWPHLIQAQLDLQVLDQSLSPNWAHEYMGTDLVREEIKAHEVQRVDLAIFDSGFEKDHINLTQEIEVPRKRNGNRFMRANHGTAVANLINGPAPYGTTDNLNLINLTAITYQSQYAYAFHRFEKAKRYPRVISNSLGWRAETTKELAQKAHELGILWFLASGNSWPTPIKEHEVTSKALLVGSFSPSGLTSFETQSDERLLVLAAANEELPSINGKGEVFRFGATSGATPIVAGTVTNILSLLPGLTRDQVFRLIQASSFSSAENKLGLSKEPGLLNAYKAFKVALKIKKVCPLSSKNCVDEKLYQKSTFQFDSPLYTCRRFKELKDQASSNFLKLMRKSALLGNKDQLVELACAYKSIGFDKNAEFYNFLFLEHLNLEHMQNQAATAIALGKYQISYYRYLNLYTPEILQDIDDSTLLKEFHKEALRELY